MPFLIAILFASTKFSENLKKIHPWQAMLFYFLSVIPLLFFGLSTKRSYCSNRTEHFLCHSTCFGKCFDFFNCIISYNLKNEQSIDNSSLAYQRTRIVILNERIVNGLNTINANDNLHPLQENQQIEQNSNWLNSTGNKSEDETTQNSTD